MTARRFLLAAMILSAGTAVGAFLAVRYLPPLQLSGEVSDRTAVFTALILASSTQIPSDRDSCEHPEIPQLTVADVVAGYAAWPFEKRSAAFQHLTCTGVSAWDCELSFGQAKDIEGWSRFLRFQYNPQDRAIPRESFQCLDVP
jgi:hypothetical protein